MSAPQMPPLPAYNDVRDKVELEGVDALTPFERIVYEGEPAVGDVEWREWLQAALQEAFELGRTAAVAPTVGPDDVKWIVNDLGELGVQIGGRCFFIYKGDSLEYPEGKHDDGTPMLYRIVGKAEFGETCWPMKWIRAGQREDRYTQELAYIPGLSFGKPEDGDWRELPVVQKEGGSHD